MGLLNSNIEAEDTYIIWDGVSITKDGSLAVTQDVIVSLKLYKTKSDFVNGADPIDEQQISLRNAEFVVLEEMFRGLNDKLYKLLIEGQYEEYTQVDDN